MRQGAASSKYSAECARGCGVAEAFRNLGYIGNIKHIPIVQADRFQAGTMGMKCESTTRNAASPF